MSDAPTISVALCTFNGARYIGEQLDSILHGTRRPDEIVIADDGSTDGTLDIVRSRLDGSIPSRILRGASPVGVTANFERAIASATSELVVLSDQDDRWAPHKLDFIVSRFAAASPDLLVLHSDARLIDAAGEPLGSTLFHWLGLSSDERRALIAGDPFPVFLRRNAATGATMTVRRTFAVSVMPFPIEWVHDEWMATLAAAAGGLRATGECLVDYRLHGGNQIGAMRPTLRHRIRRVLQEEPGRNERLARRTEMLAERMESLGWSQELIEEVRHKAHFEWQRSRLPARRTARLGTVLRWLRAGEYGRFASRGRLDAVRDLLQPR